MNQGACFNVYNAFSETKQTSLASYYASTKDCIVEYLELHDLFDLAKNNIPFKETIEIATQRINQKMVDDIDIFYFPTKYLESQNLNKTEEDIKKERQKYLLSKKLLIREIRSFVTNYEDGRSKIPKIVEVLARLRNDRVELQQNI